MAELASPKGESTTTRPKTNIHYDRSYFYTAEGVFKCIEMIFSILGLISVSSTLLRYLPRGEWYISVSAGGFTISSLFLTLHLFHITDKLKCLPWTMIEFIFFILWSVFYLIAASLASNAGRYDEAMAAAAFFGFVAMVVYFVDGYLKYREIINRRNSSAQTVSP